MTIQPTAAAVQLSTLPALGAPLADGHFAGITTQADGTHVAVVLLPDQASDIEWTNATEWAAQLGGVLPTRPVAAMLFANVKSLLRPGWHWTSDEYDAAWAWGCYFDNGTQRYFDNGTQRYFDNGTQRYYTKNFEDSAVAVRLIPLIP